MILCTFFIATKMLDKAISCIETERKTKVQR